MSFWKTAGGAWPLQGDLMLEGSRKGAAVGPISICNLFTIINYSAFTITVVTQTKFTNRKAEQKQQNNRFQPFFFSQWNVQNRTMNFQLVRSLWKQINTSFVIGYLCLGDHGNSRRTVNMVQKQCHEKNICLRLCKSRSHSLPPYGCPVAKWWSLLIKWPGFEHRLGSLYMCCVFGSLQIVEAHSLGLFKVNFFSY